MQRVLFLVEGSGERITALVNPERLEFTRRSGVRTLRHATGSVTGPALSDDPLWPTGGGSTELVLDLLFDVDLIEPLGGMTRSGGQGGEGAIVPVADVRELTRPFWALAENHGENHQRGAPPLVRFIWGQSWNVLGVVTAIAERFECFDPEGRPRRSFLRARLRRANEPEASPGRSNSPTLLFQGSNATPFFELSAPGSAGSFEYTERFEIPTDDTGLPSLRLDQLAARIYGNPAEWRLIANANAVTDPLRLAPGTVLALPSRGNGGVA
ncbi:MULTISPECIES: CIS tube protein [unclassified Ensifer]|uniref:CIS tube protein n=1 Tax=unclassified Ensifer TaxID=2633371 RepID=UPI00300FAA79